MDRKSFIQKSLAAMFIALPAYAYLSCSSGSDDSGSPSPNPDPTPDPSANCLQNGTNSSIGGNHGHTLTVSKEDVEAGTEKTYNIEGSADHNHTVIITASNFSSLKGNDSITVTSSSDDAHTHSITVSCA
ncbi:hypothetical protein [Zhouia amylolytica]|uniref:Uncharacterized protein n=1 Tax=Zhouia amylolytica AD3 TaxID=1286632 RepID=W2USQ0_9FLAO|nr:hypothetical protein [Zhouia amylolytica]ETN96332.1 hypothetical protein P278_08430 [Zhouia amylolytica AD3]